MQYLLKSWYPSCYFFRAFYDRESALELPDFSVLLRFSLVHPTELDLPKTYTDIRNAVCALLVG